MHRRYRILSVVLLFVGFLAGCEWEAASTPLPAADGLIQAYFTSPGSNAGSQALESRMVESIRAARESIDVAMYNFSLTGVAGELIAASERGVMVRVVVDSDALDSRAVQQLDAAGVALIGDRRESLMHNKFLVVDGQAVWTGSMNLTQSGLTQDNNVMVWVESGDLAGLYAQEFEEMFTLDQFGGGEALPDGAGQVQVGATPVEVLFSPDDRPSGRAVALVRAARERIDVLAYVLTQNDLRDALLDARRAGVQVRAVFDEDQLTATGNDYESLKQAGLDVRVDGISGLMHEKVIIVDGEAVWLGSYNFTRSADERNDENVLIVRDAQLAQQFTQEFQKIYDLAR